MKGIRLKELIEETQDVDLGDAYPGGEPSLRKVIASRYGLSPENVLVTAGTSEANYLVCNSFIRPGDRVVVEKPVYEPLLNVPMGLGAKVERIERRWQDDWQLPVEDLSNLSKPKLVVLANPNNPTWTLTSDAKLAELAEFCETEGCHLLVDEIFRDLAFQDAPKSAPLISDRFIATCSLSKAYGLVGLRLGWVVAHEELINGMVENQAYLSIAPSRLSEELAKVVFQKEEKLRERAKRILDRNRPLVDEWIENHEEVEWVPPPGGNFGFPRLKGHDVTRFAVRLAEKFSTLVAPGEIFGSPPHFRLGFGCDTSTLEAGLEAFDRALRS